MAISADGKFGLITNHDFRLSQFEGKFPEGTQLRVNSVDEIDDQSAPPLANMLTLIDLTSPDFKVAARELFEDQPAHVQLMPDGVHYVVGGSRNFYVFKIQDKELVLVRQSRHDRGFCCFWIHPSGKGIIATHGHPTNPSRIDWYTIDDGLNIVHNAEVRPKPGVVAERTDTTAIPRISPDGRLALVCQRAVGDAGLFTGVFVVDLLATPPNITQVVEQVGDGVESFAFHPNGKMAVVTCLSQFGNSIAVLDIESTPVRLLYHLNAGGWSQGIEFTPEGDKLFVGASFTNHIEVFDVTGEFELTKNPKFIRTGSGHNSLSLGITPSSR